MIKVLNLASVVVNAGTAMTKALSEVVFSDDTKQKTAEAVIEIKKAVDESDIRQSVADYVKEAEAFDKKGKTFVKDVKKRLVGAWLMG